MNAPTAPYLKATDCVGFVPHISDFFDPPEDLLTWCLDSIQEASKLTGSELEMILMCLQQNLCVLKKHYEEQGDGESLALITPKLSWVTEELNRTLTDWLN